MNFFRFKLVKFAPKNFFVVISYYVSDGKFSNLVIWIVIQLQSGQFSDFK